MAEQLNTSQILERIKAKEAQLDEINKEIYNFSLPKHKRVDEIRNEIAELKLSLRSPVEQELDSIEEQVLDLVKKHNELAKHASYSKRIGLMVNNYNSICSSYFSPETYNIEIKDPEANGGWFPSRVCY